MYLVGLVTCWVRKLSRTFSKKILLWWDVLTFVVCVDQLISLKLKSPTIHRCEQPQVLLISKNSPISFIVSCPEFGLLYIHPKSSSSLLFSSIFAYTDSILRFEVLISWEFNSWFIYRITPLPSFLLFLMKLYPVMLKVESSRGRNVFFGFISVTAIISKFLLEIQIFSSFNLFVKTSALVYRTFNLCLWLLLRSLFTLFLWLSLCLLFTMLKIKFVSYCRLTSGEDGSPTWVPPGIVMSDSIIVFWR